jgi:tRNA nucleotidyltransferase (CCA-adding enzyme)
MRWRRTRRAGSSTWGGQKDLAERVLRHVSDAFRSPLRVLRVARFAARYKASASRSPPKPATS